MRSIIPFNFDREMVLATRDYPHLLKNTLFINLDHKSDSPRFVQGAPDVLARAEIDDNGFELVADAALFGREEGSYAAEKGRFRALVFDRRDICIAHSHIDAYFAFDHELGHLVVPHAMGGDQDHNFHECAADAFSMIRSLQRFGRREEQNLMPLFRAIAFIGRGKTTHVTTGVMEQILKDSAHRDFSRLSPGQTVKLAAYYADAYGPKPAALKRLRQVFNKKARPENAADWERKLLAQMRTGTPLARQLAATALAPAITGLSVDGKAVTLRSDVRGAFNRAAAFTGKVGIRLKARRMHVALAPR